MAASRVPRASEVAVRRPHAAAWREALRLAGGDARRLEVLADGSVLVHNKRR